VAQYIDPESVKLGFQYIITAVIYSLHHSQPVRTLEAATGEETQERSSSAELLRNLYVSKMVSLSFSLLFMLLMFELSAFWFCFWIRQLTGFQLVSMMLTSGCVVDFFKENLGLVGFDIVEFVGSIRYFVLLNKVKIGKKQVFCKIL
jgi:hypothetical protein